MSRIDVVIPCYKYAQYLRGCVESVLSQEGVEARLLILDDCSPDNTPEVAAELVRRDPRVEYRRHEVNKRHIDTFNEGLLEWASGDYCLLLSADDLLAPGALGRATRLLDAHPEVGLVHGGQLQFEEDPPSLPPNLGEAATTIDPGLAFIEECCRMAHNPVATPTAIGRTALQHAIGGYSKSLSHTADMEMWLRFAARGSVARIEAVQAFKRMHASNMQHQYLGTALGDLKERRQTFNSFFAIDWAQVPDSQRLHGLANKGLAEAAFWSASRAFERGDVASCQQCLDYAVDLWPELASGKEWARLRWKRRLGPRAWNFLRPLIERLRGSRRRPLEHRKTLGAS